MLDNLNKINEEKAGDRSGLTRLELITVVGALVLFASIYTYVVAGALTSNPMVIG